MTKLFVMILGAAAVGLFARVMLTRIGVLRPRKDTARDTAMSRLKRELDLAVVDSPDSARAGRSLYRGQFDLREFHSLAVEGRIFETGSRAKPLCVRPLTQGIGRSRRFATGKAMGARALQAWRRRRGDRRRNRMLATRLPSAGDCHRVLAC